MAAFNSKVSLKLLIDSKSNKVLFAEAGKDFVDFLFNLLSLPVGTVIRLLTKNSMVGSLGKLYDSIENLSEICIQPNQNKDSLLKPKAPASQFPLLLAADDDDVSMTRKVYICPDCMSYFADEPSVVCPDCEEEMFTEVPSVSQTAAKGKPTDGGGFVRGVLTYMVMDDLTVKPMSIISSITLLKIFNVEEIGALEEKVVDLGMKEALNLLKHSFQSKSVLTDVFLCT